MPHMDVLVPRAALQSALSCRALVLADAAGCPGHPIKRLFEGDQARAGRDIRLVPVRVADMAQPAEILDLPISPDGLQGLATPKNLTARAVAATSLPRLVLVLLNRSLCLVGF